MGRRKQDLRAEIAVVPGGVMDSLESQALVERLQADQLADRVDDVNIADLEALAASIADSSDPNAGFIRLVLAKALLRRFESSGSAADAARSMALFRSLEHDDSLPADFVGYDRGRAAYEIGRRTGDSVLMEEARHLYREGRRSRVERHFGARRVRAQVADCKAELDRIAMVVAPDLNWSEATQVRIDIPLESIPVGEGVLPKRWRRSRPQPIIVDILGIPALVSFEPVEPGPFDGLPPRDRRGRFASGHYSITMTDESNHVGGLHVMFAREGDREQTLNELRDLARDLFLWGERANRWLDAISQPPIPGGRMHRTKYLYGQTKDSRGVRSLQLNADEPGAVNIFSIAHGHPLSRFDLAVILNRLAARPVPVAIEMLRQAQRSLELDEARTAVIEAGTAAEAALSTLYDSMSPTPRGPKWTLGRLAVEASSLPACLPAGETQASIQLALVDPRNDATHRAVVTRAEAQTAIDMSESIVNHLFGLDCRDPLALDARLVELGPHLQEFQPVTSGYTIP